MLLSLSHSCGQSNKIIVMKFGIWIDKNPKKDVNNFTLRGVVVNKVFKNKVVRDNYF